MIDLDQDGSGGGSDKEFDSEYIVMVSLAGFANGWGTDADARWKTLKYWQGALWIHQEYGVPAQHTYSFCVKDPMTPFS